MIQRRLDGSNNHFDISSRILDLSPAKGTLALDLHPPLQAGQVVRMAAGSFEHYLLLFDGLAANATSLLVLTTLGDIWFPLHFGKCCLVEADCYHSQLLPQFYHVLVLHFRTLYLLLRIVVVLISEAPLAIELASELIVLESEFLVEVFKIVLLGCQIVLEI